ncbi:unnamed protein product, partial [Scytosiphon promiscuus]
MVRQDDRFDRISGKIFKGLQSAFDQVDDYIQVFEPYRETYRANNEHMTKVKEAYAKSSLEDFHDDVEKYKGMTEEFETIPARATVG